jgi:hypothetical protein
MAGQSNRIGAGHYPDIIMSPGWRAERSESRQPARQQVITHVLGTICYRCLRAGQIDLLAVCAVSCEPVFAATTGINRANSRIRPTLVSRAVI